MAEYGRIIEGYANAHATDLARNSAFDGHASTALARESATAHVTLRRVAFIALWIAIQVAVMGFLIANASSSGSAGAESGFAEGTQVLIMADFAVVFLFMSPTLMRLLRETFLPRYISIEKNVHAHKIAGYSCILWVVVHCVYRYYKFYLLEKATKGKTTMVSILFGKLVGQTGHAMLAIIIATTLTSIPAVRRKLFELFYMTHHLYLGVIVLMFYHVTAPTFHFYITGPLTIYVADRLYRFVRSRFSRPRVLSVIQHPSNVIELRFEKRGMKTKVGQYVYLNVPSIAWFQWHPFTLTSAPEEDELSLHIWVGGDWTRQLIETFQRCVVDGPRNLDIVHDSIQAPPHVRQAAAGRSGQDSALGMHSSYHAGLEHDRKHNRDSGRPRMRGESSRSVLLNYLPREMDYYSSSPAGQDAMELQNRNKVLPAAPATQLRDLPTIMVDGPYSAPTQHVFDYQHVVLVAGGIGVTPMSSVLKSLYYQYISAPHACKVRKIHFLWVCRDVQALEWFQDLLAALDEEEIGHILEMRTYLTGELPIEQIRNIALYQDPGGPDAVTGLYRSPTYYGRPNFDKIFEDIGTRNPETDIGVFVCGPKKMARSLRGIKQKWNRILKPNKTTFILHEETT